MTVQPPLALLVKHWVFGWAASRGVPAVRIRDGWRIDIGNETRDVEQVTVRPDDAAVQRLAALADGDPRWWITVVDGDADRLATAYPKLRIVAADEVMMALPRLAATCHLDTSVTGDQFRATATITIGDLLAASGTAAIVNDVVVFDRIQTSPRFQRRGFGRQIMSALSGWAIENGSGTGVLAATLAGQGLYRTLGWQIVAPLATLGAHQGRSTVSSLAAPVEASPPSSSSSSVDTVSMTLSEPATKRRTRAAGAGVQPTVDRPEVRIGWLPGAGIS